jgi:hypothetical protein
MAKQEAESELDIMANVHAQIWELYKHIYNRGYNHSQEALNDMIKLGNMAQDLTLLRQASNISMTYRKR